MVRGRARSGPRTGLHVCSRMSPYCLVWIHNVLHAIIIYYIYNYLQILGAYWHHRSRFGPGPGPVPVPGPREREKSKAILWFAVGHGSVRGPDRSRSRSGVHLCSRMSPYYLVEKCVTYYYTLLYLQLLSDSECLLASLVPIMVPVLARSRSQDREREENRVRIGPIGSHVSSGLSFKSRPGKEGLFLPQCESG